MAGLGHYLHCAKEQGGVGLGGEGGGGPEESSPRQQDFCTRDA